MTIPASTGRRLGLLATLYLSQGLPFGFFTQALPVLMRERGLSLGAIGLTSLLAIPWALKFLWAPTVDRLHWRAVGRRRSWIIPLQAASVALVLALAWADPQATGTLSWLLGGVLLINLLAATQDIATDGLAVSLLSHAERGLGNGVQVAGYRVGMILGGGALLVAFERMGWAVTFALMGVLLALATAPVLAYREPTDTTTTAQPPTNTQGATQGSQRAHGAPQSARRAAQDEAQGATQGTRRGPSQLGPWIAPLATFLKRPGALGWLGLLVAYKGGDAMASAMLRPFLVDAGLSLEDIGLLLGAVGFGAGLLGALAGGWGTGHLGRRRALLLFGVIQAIAVALYCLPALGATHIGVLAVACAVEHFAGGMATAALFTVMMDACDPRQGGTDYTLQASVVVMASGGAAALSGFVADALGYPAHFALSALLCGLGVLAIQRAGALTPDLPQPAPSLATH